MLLLLSYAAAVAAAGLYPVAFKAGLDWGSYALFCPTPQLTAVTRLLLLLLLLLYTLYL